MSSQTGDRPAADRDRPAADRADGRRRLDSAEFGALYRRLRADWGPDDRRGGLNYLTPVTVAAAAAEVRSGRTVTLAAPVDRAPGPDNPEPARHRMTSGVSDQQDVEGLRFAADRVAMNVHGDVNSHIDALCHVIYDGALYNGVPAGTLTEHGASELSIDVARNGIVGRGVLLDIPRLRGVPWLDPGDHVTADELAEAQRVQQVQVRQGDVLLVRVGHRRRRNELGPWDAAASRAGLHPTALEFVAEKRIAVLGSDSNNDTAPSCVEGVDFPVHVLAINAMGLHLLDYLQFEALVPLCEAERRWSFLCVIAPLRLPAATGSPVNPIALM